MVLDIVEWGGEPREALTVLRQTARPVTEFGPDLNQLALDMIETTTAAKGVGLAAPQIGRDLRMFILYEPNTSPLVVINPEIDRATSTMHLDYEGCLSIPGLTGKVNRHAGLCFRYQSLTGEWRQEAVLGFRARIFQHEFDHLNGQLFVDIAKPLYRFQWESVPEGSLVE